MFNNDLKKNALANLERSQNNYNNVIGTTKAKSIELFKLRKSCSEELISEVESYINSMANTPKEFDRVYSEFKTQICVFKNVLQDIEDEFQKASVKAGSTAGAGVVAGAGVAAFAPTAAMAVATTFGTASTGTAIASLSGAAATNAALAWLGGGALAAGGGGMAAGNALLALAGPVGWGIGAVALAGGGLMARKKNKEIAEKAQYEDKKLRTKIKELETTNQAIQRTFELTLQHSSGCRTLLQVLKDIAPSNYSEFDAGQRNTLAALINHIQSLSQLINKKVQ